MGREYSEKEYDKIGCYTRDGFISHFISLVDDPILVDKLTAVSLILSNKPGNVHIMPKTLDPLRSDNLEDAFGYFDPGSGNYILFDDNDVDPNTLIQRFLHESMHDINNDLMARFSNGEQLDTHEIDFIESMGQAYSGMRALFTRLGSGSESIKIQYIEILIYQTSIYHVRDSSLS